MVLAIMTFSNIQQFQVKSTWYFLKFSNYAPHYALWFMVFNATFNNIFSYIGGGNQRKPLTCRKSLTNCIT
jgi:hypothetical protein